MTAPLGNRFYLRDLFHDPDAWDERNLVKGLVEGFALEIGDRRSFRILDGFTYFDLHFRQGQPSFLAFVIGGFHISVTGSIHCLGYLGFFTNSGGDFLGLHAGVGILARGNGRMTWWHLSLGRHASRLLGSLGFGFFLATCDGECGNCKKCKNGLFHLQPPDF